jgi:AmiR/NasT family two-component response regulator
MTTTTGPASERSLRILLANEQEDDLKALGDVLDGLGHEVTPFAVSVAEAIELIAREDPDVAFVVIDNDDEHGLALISETVEFASGPVLVTVREVKDPSLIARAADMGIAGYVDSWAPHDVQAAIDVALRRHREEARLTEKVEQLETALQRRTVIERAKGVLMERHQIGEAEAFQRLREHARSGGRRVVDVAASVLEGHALLPKQGG